MWAVGVVVCGLGLGLMLRRTEAGIERHIISLNKPSSQELVDVVSSIPRYPMSTVAIMT